jgi:hypothetical protein
MSFGPQNNSGFGALFFAQGAGGGGGVPDPLSVSTIAVSTITATNYLFANNATPLPFTYASTNFTTVGTVGSPGITLITLPFAYANSSFSVLVDYQDIGAATNPGPADVFGIWGYPIGVSTFNVVCNNPTTIYKCGYITSGTLPP